MRNLLILLLLSGCTSAQKLELFTRTSATTGKTIPVYTKGRFYYNANPNVVVSNYSRQWVDSYDPTTLYFPAYGTKPKYYISNSGLTTNTGTDSLHPWPLSKVQGGAVLPTGSVILFHRGQTFTGTVNISANTSASVVDSLIYDSYGVGARPILTTMATLPNSDTASKWRLTALPNVWALKTANQFSYTPRIFFNGGTEYPRASDSTKINATKRTSFRNADFQFIYVYSTSNPATNYTSITTACASNNTFDISGQYLVAVRNLEIRGSQGSCMDLSLNNGVLVEKCIIGRDGNRGGMRNNNVTNVIVKNNLFDSGERNLLDFNIATEGGDGVTFGQNGAHNIEVANNYFLDWRHTGYLIEDDGTTATDSVVNVRYHDNYITAPDIDYGRAFAVYYFKGSNVQMDHNVYKSCPTQNQVAADGFISQYNRYDSIANVAYYNRPTGGALSIFHSSFIPRNLQFLYDTISNCLSYGLELDVPAAGNPGYGATNCTFKGMVFQNNGWDLYTPTTDPQRYPFNSDIIVRNRRDTNYLFIRNNSFINNTFNRSTSEPPISYGQDSSTTTRFFLETTGVFNSKNGTAGDVMSNNYTNSSYSYPVVANSNYRAAEFNPELESNTNAAVDSTGAWGLAGGGAAYAAIRNNASVTTPFEYLATYNSAANKDAYVGFDTTWTLSNWFNWQFAVKVDSATGNYYYQNYAVTDTGKTIPAQIGDLYGLRKYGDGTVVAGYYRSGAWNVLKSFTYKLNSTSCYGKAAVGSNKTLLNAKTRRDRSNFSSVTATYTIGATASTSGGVYMNDGTDDILVRTLWSGEQRTPGTYTIYWDGKNDTGAVVADGNYKVKVLSNNVTYNWNGVIGNTSDNFTGSTVRTESEGMIYGMAINGNYAYYANGYHERQPTYFKFNTATPNQRITIDPQITGKSLHVATDGTNVYWSVAGTNNDYFVVATKVSDDSYVTFPNGVSKPIYLGGTYSSAIGVTNVATIDGLAGLAVQKTGSYLFEADKLNGKLLVINKTTGALAQTLAIANAGRMAVDASDNLWMITGTTVAKYPVNANGTLGTATTTLSGLVAPLALAVSPGGANVSVCDGGTSQQVKTFNNSTGALISTLGLAGGYSNGPDVNTNKFYFANTKRLSGGSDSDSHPFTFITYAPDSSFWVGDIGNYRALHFSKTNTFIEQTMNTGYHYSANADPNNPNRVFSNYLEFNVDYTKPLAPNNGSWTLVKNWAYNVPPNKDDQFSRLRSVATLSNNRTYAVAQAGASSEIVELTSTGLRFTGVTTNGYLEANGNITNPNPATQLIGNSALWTKQALLNFDSLGNPVYGAATTIGTSPVLTGKDPVDQNNGSGRVLTNGNIVTFNDANYSDTLNGNGFHVGILKNNKWLAKLSPSTYRGYEGDFPSNGDFDIGNTVGYTANYMQSIENSIFYIYHGEFYKSNQTNKINHYYSDGLFIGQAGVIGVEANGNAPAMMAGNAKNGVVVKVGSDYYLYHGDESFHGGTHRWKISGLNTISEQTIAVTKPGLPAPPAIDYVDLMAGLPYASTVANNTSGWTRSPLTDYNNSYGDRWQVLTNKTTYKTSDRDVKVANYPVSGGLLREVDRDLGSNTNIATWTISGQVAYTEPQENSGYNYMDVLDTAGKVIVRISRLDSSTNFTLAVNGTTLVNAANSSNNGFYKLQPLSIKKSGTTVTVNYSNYTVTAAKFDSAADASSPKTLRFQSSSPNNASHVVDVAKLRLYLK